MTIPDESPLPEGGLRAVTWKRFLRAPDAQLVTDLYEPALARAVRYDRCCAYFSSQVLSVAARGFGPFIATLVGLGDKAPRPAARLIVNEQLEALDLKALQATGDQSRLIDKLLRQFKTPTDALVRNRLEMLAWLVAEGLLEVRVGLMRHTHGIVHAKFGIITDAAGDRVAFMGSDNETGNALVENFEMLTVSPSWQDLESVEYYQEQFEALWADHDPQVTTMALPDAVRLKLIQFAPKQPPLGPSKEDRSPLEASLLWHFLDAAPYLPNGEYASDATALVDVWPHQRRVIEDTARAFPAGRLLCDEVGMGKTIEAILVLRRLLCGRGVQRALILVPAGLLKQWQDELREKGGLLVPRWESGVLFHPNGDKQNVEAADALAGNPLLLLSREWARLDGNVQTVLAAAPPWDLVLLDEAHAARRSSPEEGGFNQANLLLGLLRDLQLRRRTRGLLLLSATPMQTQPWEPWDLLQTLGVGDDWLVEFGDIRAFYDGVAGLTKGSLATSDVKAAARLVSGDAEFPPSPLPVKGSLESALAFATSEKRQQFARWLRCGAPLGRLMHRNTRDTLRDYFRQGLLDTNPPRREVRDEVFDYGVKAEREVYDAVADYIHERFDHLEHQKAGKGFVMTVYRRRAASSPHALRRSLERRLEGLERVIRKQHQGDWLTAAEVGIDPLDLSDADADEKIDPALPTSPKEATAEAERVRHLLEKLDALGLTDSKLAHFFGVLQDITGDGRAALVFTEYADTLEYLRDQLLPTYGVTLGCYSGMGGQVWVEGAWQTVTKADITQRLRQGELRVLICTDAASEGLNLQAASALVNYDMPWNPSKVEQRIGRIDRIGQKQSELPIRNLFLTDSVDMQVYQMLRRRCGLFEHFVGPMQPVLALARDALQSNLRRADTDAVLQALEAAAQNVQDDHAATSAFVASDAVPLPEVVPPAARQDLTLAMTRLVGLKGGLSVTTVKDRAACWRVGGLGKGSVLVSTDRETLERDRNVLPLTLGSALVPSLLKRLSPLGSRSPLVLAEYQEGPYRCVEARWVGAGAVTPVTSVGQLQSLLAAWGGSAPSPSDLLIAQKEAQAAAGARAEEMRESAETQVTAGLQRQTNSARKRLLRELARTLRCLGSGDLNGLLEAQFKAERSRDRRYHRALELLGGYPPWALEQIADADAFVQKTPTSKRQARIAGSEIDAALADPRWRGNA